MLDWVGNNENDIEEAAAKKEARLKRQEEQKAKARAHAKQVRKGTVGRARDGLRPPRSTTEVLADTPVAGDVARIEAGAGRG